MPSQNKDLSNSFCKHNFWICGIKDGYMQRTAISMFLNSYQNTQNALFFILFLSKCPLSKILSAKTIMNKKL